MPWDNRWIGHFRQLQEQELDQFYIEAKYQTSFISNFGYISFIYK